METPGLPQLIYQIRWSPPQGMYIASTVEYPDVTFQHPESMGAIQGLKDELKLRLGDNTVNDPERPPT